MGRRLAFICPGCRSIVVEPQEKNGVLVCPECSAKLKVDLIIPLDERGVPEEASKGISRGEADLDKLLSRIQSPEARDLSRKVIDELRSEFPGLRLVPCKHDYVSLKLGKRSKGSTLGWIAVRNYGIGIEPNYNVIGVKPESNKRRIRVTSLEQFRGQILPVLRRIAEQIREQ